VSDRFRTFGPVTALLWSLRVVTAPFWSSDVRIAPALTCAGPIEFGATAFTAATLVPPSATTSAMQATTIAGDGLCAKSVCM
jgi:hypothetical protein